MVHFITRLRDLQLLHSVFAFPATSLRNWKWRCLHISTLLNPKYALCIINTLMYIVAAILLYFYQTLNAGLLAGEIYFDLKLELYSLCATLCLQAQAALWHNLACGTFTVCVSGRSVIVITGLLTAFQWLCLPWLMPCTCAPHTCILCMLSNWVSSLL